MNSFDLIIMLLVGLAGVLGLYWGVIRQVVALLGVIAGTVLAGVYGGHVAGWLGLFAVGDTAARVVGYLVVLTSVSTLASLGGSLLRVFAGLFLLGWLDHALGALLGVLQTALLFGVVVSLLTAFPLPLWNDLLAQSSLAGLLLRMGTVLTPLLPVGLPADGYIGL